MSAFMKEFSPKEQEDIFSLVEKISGTKKASNDKPHVFLNNIKRRMVEVNISNLYDYISYAKKNQNEYDHLVSSLTIHTTHWFREPRHFSLIENEVIQSFSKKKIRVLSLGCSTGEEVYSIALTLDKLRLLHPGFDYEVYGYDIDGVSVKKAVKCIYKDDGFEKIPEELKGNVLLGSGKTQGLMTLSKNIRERCHFDVMNALKIQANDIGLFDIVFCRNMLIYFTTDQVQSIVRNLVNKVNIGGILCVGHSEDVSYYTKQLERLTGSTYRKNKEPKQQLSPLMTKDKVGALVMTKEGSCIQVLDRVLESAECYVQEVSSLNDAGELLQGDKFGIIFLDMEFSQDIIKWLVELRKSGVNIPCVVLASSSINSQMSVEALSSYVQDIFPKETLESQSHKLSERVVSLLKSKQILKRRPKDPVLVVDDDDDVLEMFCDVIESQNFKTESFTDPVKALEYLKINPVHCVVTDYRMPEMSGEVFSKKIKECRSNIPIVMITGFSNNNQNLEKEGVLFRFLEKPVPTEKLSTVLHDATRAKYTGELTPFDSKSCLNKSLIVIGSSTGGPQVLQLILGKIADPNLPPIVVVQHIQKNFQLSFAENLSKYSGLNLIIVDKETTLEKGKIYLAQPDYHIKIRRRNQEWKAYSDDSDQYKGHRPCVEHLFQSTADCGEKDVMGIILTGMGDDGSQGLLNLNRMGAYTIAQDLKSSVVFGMPRVAIDLGGATFVGDVDQIRKAIQTTIKK